MNPGNLAYRMRPQSLDTFLGQEHLVGKNGIIRRMLSQKQLFPMIFWGPPGSGKTTLAKIIASESDAEFHEISGVSAGKADLQKIIAEAENARQSQTIVSQTSPLFAKAKRPSPMKGEGGRRTILFIDEIHRWNKAQQDGLLPNVESGLIILIGATTENPSFEVISALLSRSRIFVLQSLSVEDLSKLIDTALTNEKNGLGSLKKTIAADAKELLIRLSGGDARIMLNALEISAMSYKQKEISAETVKDVFQTKSAGIYDKKADEHYNTISAFIKSMRGSDPDASLYYLMRMLENGEDPKFIARRMIIFASEDIGLADRGALIQANACFEAVTKIGMPEAQLILAHIVLYLATAKKSRAVANALGKAKSAVYELPNEPIPLHLRNAPTKLMKNLGYAKDYQWSEEFVGPKNDLSFLPEKLKNKKFFES
ncbi:MAG TPA: replication-associated recombination protein A [Patescibacteria group bacterium]|nr:replication-associated recombination protein A [Patescibacteria group bacterium]